MSYEVIVTMTVPADEEVEMPAHTQVYHYTVADEDWQELRKALNALGNASQSGGKMLNP